jgi:lipoprotein NlpI
MMLKNTLGAGVVGFDGRKSRIATTLVLAGALAIGSAGVSASSKPLVWSSAAYEDAYQRLSRDLGDADLHWETRVQTLRRRGVMLSNHGYLEQALTDFEEAANLAPHYSIAHLDRGLVLTRLDRFDEAYISYKAGFQANPSNLVLFMGRGMAHFNDGKYRKARRDFQRYLAHNKHDVLRMLWLYLAASHEGRDAKTMLNEYATEVDTSAWPGQLYELYRGQADVTAVLDAARDGASGKALARLCEANFYIGQLKLLRGDTDGARQYFRDAVATNAVMRFEHSSAQHELNRLAAQ